MLNMGLRNTVALDIPAHGLEVVHGWELIIV
jgi:hypothetical protein